MEEPQIAVVIPVYKQPQYLKDAVTSVLKQSIIEKVRIVIVNDGCPYRTTDQVARIFFDAYPGLVFYLTKPNGGLSSARNHGIRFALDCWPSVKALFPLDADNKLSARTLEKLHAHLNRAPADIGWIYQDLVTFGTEEQTWQTGLPFSLYRLLHENCCDAGSLIHRRLFETGLWFDEQMRSGYEDWEFFVNAALHGFKGVHSPETRFLYRRRGHSMLSDSKADHHAIIGYIRHKHAAKLRQDDLSRLEHAEMPRFAIVDVETGLVTCATNPLDSNATVEPVDHLIKRMVTWAGERPPKSTYFPPVMVFAHGKFIQLLKRLRMLPSILLMIQKALGRVELYELRFASDAIPHKVELIAGSKGGAPVIYGVATRKLLGWALDNHSRLSDLLAKPSLALTESATIKLGTKWFAHGEIETFAKLRRKRQKSRSRRRRRISRQRSPLARQAAALIRRLAHALSQGKQREARLEPGWVMPSHANFAGWKHLDSDETTFPFFAKGSDVERHVLFLLPWMQLGGVELCIVNLAREMVALSPNLRLHLIMTLKNHWEAAPECIAIFNTVSFVPLNEADRDKAISTYLAYADIIINAHSLAGYQFWPAVRRKTDALFLSFLQVIDLKRDSLPCGYPVIAARQFENVIDYFVVPSDKLRRSCESFGVPPDKIILARNAAVVSPATRQEAFALAKTKAARCYSRKKPLRVLFSGRFDEQKGIGRLEKVATQLRKSRLPCQFYIRGKAVISTGQRPPNISGARIAEPSTDPHVLARSYSEADIFLLPSRWEGVPLTILEAMSFGCIVIATDVGGISEVIEDGTSGFLISSEQSDSEIAAAMCELIEQIIANPENFAAMRITAVERALGYSWKRSAEIILARLEQHLQQDRQ